MLPNTKHTPATFSQHLSNFAVTLHVPSEFGFPERDARFWNSSVARTAMPETTVNKHRELRRTQNEIGFAWQRHSAPPAGYAMFAH